MIHYNYVQKVSIYLAPNEYFKYYYRNKNS